MQIRKGNDSGMLTQIFSNGDETVVSYYIHNNGDADLDWSLQLKAQDAGWLQVRYNGVPKIGSAIAFSGTLAANEVSDPIEVSLNLAEISYGYKRVPNKYLEVKEVNGKRVEKNQYGAKLIFKNENTGATEKATASIYLWIPRMNLKMSSPARKSMWQLPVKKGDHDYKRILIEKKGKGNLRWQNIPANYNSFNLETSKQINGGYFRVKVRRKSKVGNKTPSVGDHMHLGIISNSGSTYKNQPEPGVRWLHICIVNGNVNGNTKCPEHKNDHH